MAKATGTTASPALLAAQQRLASLRQQRRADRLATGLPVVTDEQGCCPPAPQGDPCRQEQPTGKELPAHLGWGSEAVTAAIRVAQQRQAQRQAQAEAQDLAWLPSMCAGEVEAVVSQPAPSAEPSLDPPRDTVTLYPDIALGLLRQEAAAAGRIWLLLRFIDATGSGWVSVDEAREQLTGKQSPLRVCGRRQLRNLLAQGENVFWQRQNDRLWLRSAARVAAALNIWRLTSRPVALPVSVLTGSIGTVRAHLYASFHSGRNPHGEAETGHGGPHTAPIARATLQRISHVDRRTQRIYEKRAGVQKQYNVAVTEKATAEAAEKEAWQHGHALFCLTDHEGKLGRPGITYLAWQLPNNYVGPHVQQPRGRQKRINQELADLFMKGMTGNSEELVDSGTNSYHKRYYGNGQLAAKAYNRSADQDIYWRSWQQTRRLNKKNGCFRLWHLLPARG